MMLGLSFITPAQQDVQTFLQIGNFGLAGFYLGLLLLNQVIFFTEANAVVLFVAIDVA
jgi:hypothetical protein